MCIWHLVRKRSAAALVGVLRRHMQWEHLLRYENTCEVARLVSLMLSATRVTSSLRLAQQSASNWYRDEHETLPTVARHCFIYRWSHTGHKTPFILWEVIGILCVAVWNTNKCCIALAYGPPIP